MVYFSSLVAVEWEVQSARPAVKLNCILIGIKTGDKGLMKELIDNTNSASQTLQLRYDSRANTQLFQNRQILQLQAEREKSVWRSWPAVKGWTETESCNTSRRLRRYLDSWMVQTTWFSGLWWFCLVLLIPEG